MTIAISSALLIRLFTILIWLLTGLGLAAGQVVDEPGRLTGRLPDGGTHQPLSFATVTVQTNADNQIHHPEFAGGAEHSGGSLCALRAFSLTDRPGHSIWRPLVCSPMPVIKTVKMRAASRYKF